MCFTFTEGGGEAWCLQALSDLGFHFVIMLEVFIFNAFPIIYNQSLIPKHFLKDSLMKVYFFCHAEKH